MARGVVPPADVRDAARAALEARRAAPPSRRGLTRTGLARARDLAAGRAVSPRTIARMVAFFDRHERDQLGATWDARGRGWVAWHAWGGTNGRWWALEQWAQQHPGEALARLARGHK